MTQALAWCSCTGRLTKSLLLVKAARVPLAAAVAPVRDLAAVVEQVVAAARAVRAKKPRFPFDHRIQVLSGTHLERDRMTSANFDPVMAKLVAVLETQAVQVLVVGKLVVLAAVVRQQAAETG